MHDTFLRGKLIYVEDLAVAHILALKYLENGGKTNYFNLGTNEGNTVTEVFKACESVTQKHIPRKEFNQGVLVILLR